MASDDSHMLEAALEQMDDIIAGGFCEAFLKFGAQGYHSQGSNSAPTFALTSAINPNIRVLQLVEDLRVALEGQVDQEEHDSMSRQVPMDTAHTLLDWLEKGGVSPVEKAKETKQKEKKQSIYPAVAALQLFTLFCCGGKVKLKKTRASQYRQSKKDQDEDTASDTGSDWSGGDVTTKKVKDKSNGKANQRTPRQVKTHVEEIYIRPDSPTLPRAHSSLSQFSQARNLAILPLEWQLPGVPLTTSSMATRTERKPSTTNTSTQAQTETQTTDMNTDTQTTATSQRQISMVTTQSSETMTEVHTSDSSTQNSTPDMALTPESTKDMIATDEDVKDDSAEDLISTLTDTFMEKSVQ
ncbi:uncharacterized protein LOC123480991 isoform X3 [Coregonus clupeaformis]|uniref:uncharacterized protein LOC123480991 isoform X3 n=1 Tax=Coregonus clupeaformis TaxID=59861 RepID=UPI001E1C7832|nr:uncharacterized protein LOC123480991 isoform X3 [Coregonus clupeaformis]